jgi:hypothetical protein
MLRDECPLEAAASCEQPAQVRSRYGAQNREAKNKFHGRAQLTSLRMVRGDFEHWH